MNEAEKEYRRTLKRREYDRYWTLPFLVFFTGLKKEVVLKKVAQGTIPFKRRWRKLFFDPVQIRSWLRHGIPQIEYPARGYQRPKIQLVKTRIEEY